VNESFQEKILILRFSSFGDVTQCLSVASKLSSHFKNSVIHWAVREDLSTLLQHHPSIQRIIALPRKSNFKELVRLAWQLRHENYTRIYDAHNSTRSWIISLVLGLTTSAKILRKSQMRWKRILLFKFRWNLYQMPRSGQRDLIDPLKKWGIQNFLPDTPQLFLLDSELEAVKKILPSKKFVALAPSAAFELKRWPVDHWKELIGLDAEQNFVLLGGPDDHFLQEIQNVAPHRVLNLAGQTNLRQSACVVQLSELLISNDTGLLHTAEQLGHPAIALMGPAPFGFPSRSKTKILQLDLKCRPCSKHGQGPCVNPEFQKCLRGISVQSVYDAIQTLRVST
jgi:ADP-heptose:LPS heptosyltransferase